MARLRLSTGASYATPPVDAQTLADTEADDALTAFNDEVTVVELLADTMDDDAKAEAATDAIAFVAYVGNIATALLAAAPSNQAFSLSSAQTSAAQQQQGTPGTGGFFSSLGSSLYSVGTTYYAIGCNTFGYHDAANRYYAQAYNQGPIGQAEKIGPVTYGVTVGSLGVATVATGAAVGLNVASYAGVSQVGAVPLRHALTQATIEFHLWSGAALTYTETVAGHGDRPYQYSRTMIDWMVRTRPAGIGDPQGAPGAMRYVVPGSWWTSEGLYELVIDTSGKVLHCLFRSQ